jgi:hypothetical protein
VDVLSTQQVHVMRHNTQHTAGKSKVKIAADEGGWMTSLEEKSQGAQVAKAAVAVPAGEAGGSAAGSACVRITVAAEIVALVKAGMGRQ